MAPAEIAEGKKSTTPQENAHFKTSVKDTLKHGGALMSLLSSAPVIVDSRFSNMKPATFATAQKNLSRGFTSASLSHVKIP